MPADLCEQIAKTRPDILKYGKYRILDNGKVEHVQYCDQVTQPDKDGNMVTIPNVQNYTSFHKSTVKKWLDELAPEEK